MNSLISDLIDNAADGVIVVDPKGDIRYANQAFCKLFGYSREELIMEGLDKLMPLYVENERENILDMSSAQTDHHLAGTGRIILGKNKTGTEFPFHVTATSFEAGGELLFAGIIHDIASEIRLASELEEYTKVLENIVDKRSKELHRAVIRLEQVNTDLERALGEEQEMSRMKSRFVSMASHEFRSPLSRISLSASIIERYHHKFGTDKIIDHLRSIRHSVNDLTVTLNDFLSLESIENGRLSVRPEEIDLIFFIHEILEDMHMELKKGQVIHFDPPIPSRPMITNTHLLKHCLVNLIGNAVKYSPADGAIEVVVEVATDHCAIHVKDNGIGIAEEDQYGLFEPFYRATNTVEIPGNGLGLYIVKRYMSLLSGKVTFVSLPKKGSTFSLTFPI